MRLDEEGCMDVFEYAVRELKCFNFEAREYLMILDHLTILCANNC